MKNTPKCVRGIVVLLLLLTSIVDIRAADTTPPLVLSKSPLGTVVDTVLNISATTNENSICKYDTLNVLYNDMRNLFPGNTLSHKQELNLSDGDYIYYIRCKDSSDNFMTSSEILSFTVDSTGGGDVSAPSIISYAPQNTIKDTAPNLVVVTNEEATCKYSENDEAYTAMPNLMGGTINHVAPLVLSAGNYLYYVRCRDGYGNTMSNSFEIEFGIDNTPPDVLDYSPTVANTNYVELEISTNENAYCRYSISSLPYSDMSSVFEVTGHKIHRTGIEFNEDGFQELFIRCKDEAGNIATKDFSAIIDVDTPPSAEIFLSQDSPIKPGTVQVTVFTSEPLIGTPELTYELQSPNGNVNTYTVPLSGHDRTWQGFMIIEGGDDKRIGDFSFKGIDFGGNEGTMITAGNTFLVDSTTPKKVDTIVAEALSTGDVRLEWNYDDNQDIAKFIIYRSLVQGVTTLDYYDETSSEAFTDGDTEPNTAYYYKVIAVDKAGNKGLLSKEVTARTVVPEGYQVSSAQQETSTASAELQSNLIPKVDDVINKYKGFQKTTDDIVLYYRGNSGLDDQTIQDLGLLTTASTVKGQVNKYIVELENLKKQDLTSDELDEKLRSLELKIESQKSRLPLQVTKGDLLSINNEIDLADTNDAIDGILSLYRILDIDANIRDKYAKASMKIQQDYTINGTAQKYSVKYYDGTTKDLLFVKKHISPSSDKIYENAIAVENIPDALTNNVNDVVFVGTKSTILKQDAMVKFDLGESLEIKYYLYGTFSTLQTIDAKTIILDDNTLYFNELGKEPTKEKTSNTISGNVISNAFSNPKFKSIGGLILGILAVAGLAIYYFTMDSGSFKFTKKPDKQKKISQQLKPLPQHKTTITQENASAMLEKAHLLIDSLQFNDANEIYSELVKNHVTSLDQASMNDLYKKLDLYMNVHHATIASSKKDTEDLYAKLTTVAQLYNDICNEQNCNNALMTHAKQNYDAFAAQVTEGKQHA